MGRSGRKEITIGELREHQSRYKNAAESIRKVLAKLEAIGATDDSYAIRVESMIDKLEKSAKDAVKSTLNVADAVDELIKEKAKNKGKDILDAPNLGEIFVVFGPCRPKYMTHHELEGFGISGYYSRDT